MRAMAANRQASNVHSRSGSPEGDRIAFLRHVRGAGLAETAIACGMSADTYAGIEDGLRRASGEEVIRIAAALQVEPEALGPWQLVVVDSTSLDITLVADRRASATAGDDRPSRWTALSDAELSRIRDLDSVVEAWEALDRPCGLGPLRAWLEARDVEGEPMVAALMDRDRRSVGAREAEPASPGAAPRDLEARWALMAALVRATSA